MFSMGRIRLLPTQYGTLTRGSPMLALITQLVVSVGLARFIFPATGFAWHAETVAHVIGVAVPVFTSYLGHKHFSFAAKA